MLSCADAIWVKCLIIGCSFFVSFWQLSYNTGAMYCDERNYGAARKLNEGIREFHYAVMGVMGVRGVIDRCEPRMDPNRCE